MLPPAGPASRQPLPHTRTRTVHWAATAAALAAVVGGSALAEPPGATALPTPGTATTAPGPDPEAARYPLECGPWRPEVVHRAAVDFDGDGRAETVAVVRCASGVGTPPSGMYVLAHPAEEGARPRIAETLVDPGEQLVVREIGVRGRTVTARLLGYSSEDVPRCCPDQGRDVEWNWRDGKFVLRAAPVAGSV